VHDGSGLEGLFPYGGFVADVFEGDLLVIVHKENRALGGMDDFFDLVFPKVAVHAGFFVEAVGFIGQQNIEGVVFAFDIGPGAFEEGVDAGQGKGTGEPGFKNFAGCRIFGDVLDKASSVG